jgi:hypothetical protein
MDPGPTDLANLEATELEALDRPLLIALILELRKQLEEQRATIEQQAARIVELERKANQNSRKLA